MIRAPALFVGHGSPMNAIEDNASSRTWAALAQSFPRPRAVLCVSAHWETRGTFVTAAARPATIHDFGGFPQALFDVRYPAPGDPELAQAIARSVQVSAVQLDAQRGLDHGSWSVLRPMYPDAAVPVLQLSLDATQGPDFHYRLGRELRPWREHGVLVMGTGDIVHNLRAMDWAAAGGFDWAEAFDRWACERIEAGAHAELAAYPARPEARLAVPTAEHYLPLLYVLGAAFEDEAPQFFNRGIVMGSISMTGVAYGAGLTSRAPPSAASAGSAPPSSSA